MTKPVPARAGTEAGALSVVVSRDHLQELLAAVAPAVLKGHGIQALTHVLLTAEGDGEGVLRAEATDLDLCIRTSVPAEVASPGPVLVPAALLTQLVARLPRADLELHAGVAGGALEVRAGRSRHTLKTLALDEWPRIDPVPFDGESGSLTLPGSLLWPMISATAFAVSTEDTRPIMNGVYLHVHEGADPGEGAEFQAVATNGHRMALAAVPAPEGAAGFLGVGDDAGVIVHPRALAAAEKLLGEAEAVEIARDRNRLALRAGGERSGEVSVRLIGGPYPIGGVNRVIAACRHNEQRHAVVHAASLRTVLERCAVLATNPVSRVDFAFREGEPLRLEVGNHPSDSGQAAEEVACEYTGAPLTIGASHTYLGDALRRIPSEAARWSFGAESTPMLLTPAGSHDGPRVLYVVAPCART